MINDLKKIYNDWINKSVKFNQNDEFIEIQTPFVDLHHDYIHLVLYKNQNDYIISDDGHVINELDMLGFNAKSTKIRKEYFEKTLRIFGVQFNADTDELFIQFEDLFEFPKKQYSLIQSMIKISDMLQTSRSNVINIFTEDIKLFFDENEIIYTPDLNFMGKSGNQQNFDFVIPRIKNEPEKLIRAINRPTIQNYKNVVFPFIEVNELRSESEYFILANDSEQDISDKFINSVRAWNVNVLPWSNKDEIVNTFKVI